MPDHLNPTSELTALITALQAGRRPVGADDATRLATALLELAEQAMPPAFFAMDSRCRYARTVLAAVLGQVDLDDTDTPAAELPDDDYTTDLVERIKVAADRNGASRAWSYREQLGVALALRDRAHLAELSCTPTQAAHAILDGMLLPPADFNAWLAAVRAAAGVR